MTKLKPCPFCGVKPTIQLVDDEGNFHSEDYAEAPYSGIGFVLRHDVGWDECPIATNEDESLGSIIYESYTEIENLWNRRVGESNA